MCAFQITKPAQAVEGFHGILYGNPKTGKTSTLDDPNFKVLLIDLEGGSAVLSEADKVDRIAVTSYEQFIEVMTAVENGELNGYDLYAIDSYTKFQDMVMEYVATVYAPRRSREIQGKFGAMADWGDLKQLLVKTTNWVHSMTKRNEKSIHVLWIAHVAEVKDEITKALVATKIQLQGGSTAEVVSSIVDGLFYMYNKSIQNEDGSVDIERGILTRPIGAYMANARQSKKRDPLPAKIVSPVWSDIFKQLGYVKQTKQLSKEGK